MKPLIGLILVLALVVLVMLFCIGCRTLVMHEFTPDMDNFTALVGKFIPQLPQIQIGIPFFAGLSNLVTGRNVVSAVIGLGGAGLLGRWALLRSRLPASK